MNTNTGAKRGQNGEQSNSGNCRASGVHKCVPFSWWPSAFASAIIRPAYLGPPTRRNTPHTRQTTHNDVQANLPLGSCEICKHIMAFGVGTCHVAPNQQKQKHGRPLDTTTFHVATIFNCGNCHSRHFRTWVALHVVPFAFYTSGNLLVGI